MHCVVFNAWEDTLVQGEGGGGKEGLVLSCNTLNTLMISPSQTMISLNALVISPNTFTVPHNTFMIFP